MSSKHKIWLIPLQDVNEIIQILSMLVYKNAPCVKAETKEN